MKYVLHIIWTDNDKTEYEYDTRSEAETAMHNFKMVFGNQIDFIWINERV